MEKYNWTTAKGAKVEMAISQEHTEIIDADGEKIETIKKGLRLETLRVNGIEYTGKLSGKMIEFTLGGKNAAAYIPENIYQKIMQPTFKRLEAERQADAEYQKNHDAIVKMMSY